MGETYTVGEQKRFLSSIKIFTIVIYVQTLVTMLLNVPGCGR